MCDFGTLVVLRAKIRTEAPGLRQLLSSEALALMAARLSKADDLESIAVEATHRLWLFGGMTGPAWEREQQHCLDILRHAHIDEELILSWAKQNLYQRTFSFHGNLLPNSYTAAVNMRLNHWLGADGVGIFVSTKAPELPLSESILLPFKLVQHRNEGAFTADGIALSHLNTGIQAGLNLARQNDYRSQEKTAVVFHTLQGDCSDLLFGESLGLAVFLALVKRKEASEFTVFDCMASGVLDQGALYQNDPEMYGKKYAAFTETGVKKILLPYFGEAAEDNSRDVFIQAQESVNDHVRRTLEDLKPIDLNKIKEEVDKLGTQIRFGSIEYEKAKNRLLYLQDRLKAAGCSTKTGSQALQMTISLHLGAVHNHLGETEEAGGRLKAAMDSRLDENEKLHACIRYAITLKDMQEYEQAQEILKEVQVRIPDSFTGQDLRMRFHGTRGQVILYENLGFEKEEERYALCSQARMDFQKARDLAESAEDIGQDSCYLYLAKALLCPETISEEETEETRQVCQSTGSAPYFQRAQWLAAYRHLLLGLPDLRLPRIDLPPCMPNMEWVYALSLKYRGAVRSALGDWEGAEEDFKKAHETLETSKGLIALLHISILLQAAESFRNKNSTLSGEWLELAYHYCCRMEAQKKMIATKWVAPWKAYIEHLLQSDNKGSGRMKNPQLSFPY